MARTLSEKQFNQLQAITHQLQALTDEQSDVAIEKGTHKLKPITGAYIV